MKKQHGMRFGAIKPIIANISLCIIPVAIIAGIYFLRAGFGRISAQIILAPVHLLLAFPSNIIAVAVIAAAVFMVYKAYKDPKFWYLPPIAAALVGIIWLVACNVIVQLVQRR